MSSDPKRLDDLIPFNEITVEKTVPGNDPAKSSPTPETPVEKTYAGTDLPDLPDLVRPA